MMKRILIGLLSLCCIAGVAFGGTEAGQTEVQVAGSLQNVDMDEFSMTTLSGQLNINRFLSDNFSLGCALRVSLSEEEDGDKSTSMQTFLLGRGDFYLGTNFDVIPYIGAQIGVINYEYNDDSESTFTYGAHGGFKFFLSENISWNAELDVSVYTQEADYGEDTDITVTSFLVGMSYYFGS